MNKLKVIYYLASNPTFKIKCNTKKIINIYKKYRKSNKRLENLINIREVDFKKVKEDDLIKKSLKKEITEEIEKIKEKNKDYENKEYKNKESENKEKKKKSKKYISRLKPDKNLKNLDSDAITSLTFSKIIYSPSLIDTFSKTELSYRFIKRVRTLSAKEIKHEIDNKNKSNKSNQTPKLIKKINYKEEKNSQEKPNRLKNLKNEEFITINIPKNKEIDNNNCNKIPKIILGENKGINTEISNSYKKNSSYKNNARINTFKDFFSPYNISKRIKKKELKNKTLDIKTISEIHKKSKSSINELLNISKFKLNKSKDSTTIKMTEPNSKISNIINKDLPSKYSLIFQGRKKIYDSFIDKTYRNTLNMLYSFNENNFSRKYMEHYKKNKYVKGFGLTHINLENPLKTNNLFSNQLEAIREKISLIKSIYDFAYPEILSKKSKLNKITTKLTKNEFENHNIYEKHSNFLKNTNNYYSQSLNIISEKNAIENKLFNKNNKFKNHIHSYSNNLTYKSLIDNSYKEFKKIRDSNFLDSNIETLNNFRLYL